MSDTPTRHRVSSLPATGDRSSSSRMLHSPPSPPSTTTASQSFSRTAASSPTASRAPSNHNPPAPAPVTRARRQATSGFLLDNGGSQASSLDFSDKGLYHQSSYGSVSTAGVAATPDTDPAMMVDLVLGEAQKRKHDRRPRGNTLTIPPTATSSSEPFAHRRPHGGRGRPTSPSRSFLMSGGRSPSSSTGAAGRKYSPPPPPGRPNFPTLSLSPLPFGGTATTVEAQKKRWSVGREQLRELQKEFKFSEATLQRTLNAKRSLELSAVFKKLLEIEATRVKNLAVLQNPGDSEHPPEKLFEYNPLYVIRNRKLRNRKKIHLDGSPWEDPGAVEQWVEDVAVSIYSPAGVGAGGLPNPPPGQGRKLKRPKMDWIIEPEEMLADYYWVRCEKSKHRESEKEIKKKRRGMKNIDTTRANYPISLEVPDNDLGYRPSEEDLKISTKVPRKKRTVDGVKGYHQFPNKEEEEGYESTATSSEDGNSDSDYLYNYSGSEDLDNLGPNALREGSKRHRRRRGLRRIIEGRHHNGKKKKLKQHELELEEKWRKQEAEEMDWIASETEERYPVPVLSDQPEYRKSIDADEEYELAPTGRSPIKNGGKVGFSTNFCGGSRSSLERYGPASTGLGITTSSVDRADYVVPSIAISLSPPRIRSHGAEDKDDDKKDKISPHKKLLGMRKDGNGKEKEVVEDSGRESLDIDRCYRKSGDRAKSPTKLAKVRSRVDKLRNEVSKVEDLILWKRDNGSSAPSPTTSSFTASDDEERVIRAQVALSASEFEDPDSAKSKLGPDARKSRPPHHRNHYSTGQLPTLYREHILRRSFDSDREVSPERRSGSKLREPIRNVVREHSPAREVKIESFRRKAEDHLALARLKTLQPPFQLFTDVPEEPTKHQPPAPQTPSTPAISKRNLHRAHITLLSSGILARGINIKTPTLFNPRLRALNASSRDIDALLQQYGSKQVTFTGTMAPRYHTRIARVNKNVSHTLTPMVRSMGDEADGLSTHVTTELTLNVKKLQDEIFTLARRRKGRGKMRWVRRALWVAVEWVVVVLMWVVWSVFLGFRIVRAVLGAAVRIVRWVLWL